MKLAILGGQKTIEQCKQFIWPRITDAVKNVVIAQLEQDISLYNRSGIFEEFETNFAQYHGRKYALLENSGTSALFAMYEGINLQAGDEVICPSYTFFATVGPLMHFGAIPVFCDCKADGNIDPGEIKAKISPRTKAVVITHMWGMPCDMDEITSICKEAGIFLLEDCSHAHGASYKGKKLGSFGHVSAWSLQGKKTITGGEGGILTTDDPTVYYRALLQGHYNNRCKQEIPKDNPLYEFALTGYGLKLRAHPLAIAIANEQFSHLDTWIKQRQMYAEQIIQGLEKYPFLKMPQYADKQPSWYAFVMQYEPTQSNGISIDLFEKAVLAEGLKELDRPGSTRSIHDLPLFTKPHIALPRLYQQPITQSGSFTHAETFYRYALKLPVWAFPDEQEMVSLYIQGIQKVADIVQHSPDLLLA